MVFGSKPDTGIRDEVGLEFSDVHVQRTVEAQRRRQGRDALRHETIQICVRRTLDIKIATANVIHGLIVRLVRDVGMLKKRVHAQNSVVRFYDGRRNLRARPHGEPG